MPTTVAGLSLYATSFLICSRARAVKKQAGDTVNTFLPAACQSGDYAYWVLFGYTYLHYLLRVLFAKGHQFTGSA